MKRVKLVGLTSNAKNRIREHGDVWDEVPHTITPAPPANEMLLRSVKDKYLKWFVVGWEVTVAPL